MVKLGLASMATVFIVKFMMKVVYHIRKGYKFKKYKMDLDNMDEVLTKINDQLDKEIID